MDYILLINYKTDNLSKYQNKLLTKPWNNVIITPVVKRNIE